LAGKRIRVISALDTRARSGNAPVRPNAPLSPTSSRCPQSWRRRRLWRRRPLRRPTTDDSPLLRSDVATFSPPSRDPPTQNGEAVPSLLSLSLSLSVLGRRRGEHSFLFVLRVQFRLIFFLISVGFSVYSKKKSDKRVSAPEKCQTRLTYLFLFSPVSLSSRSVSPSLSVLNLARLRCLFVIG